MNSIHQYWSMSKIYKTTDVCLLETLSARWPLPYPADETRATSQIE